MSARPRSLLHLLLALLRVWLVLVVTLALAVTPAWASCSMSTFTGPDGRTLMCVTCCVPGLCQTTCN